MKTEHEVVPPGELRRHQPRIKSSWTPPLGRTGFWVLIAIALFYLLSEHRAHFISGLSWLPFLLLLACSLMHMFGHGAHGGHGTHSAHDHATQGGSEDLEGLKDDQLTRHKHDAQDTDQSSGRLP